ncbi:MAG: hypothetical protein LBH70_03575 [Spirochaetaceae bacterium]|jgi:hypothetical protein|nr:hypothetical protein [Spirochaetaceae bacterium]
MKHLWSCFFYRLIAGFFLNVLALIPPQAAAAQTSPGPPVFPQIQLNRVSTRFLWTGSWGLSGIHVDEADGLTAGTGNLINRGEVRITTLGVAARFLALDRRPAVFWEQPDGGSSAFSGGVYHNRTGSRLLYGVLEEWGLPARLKNPWGKSLSFAGSRRPLGADVKTGISSAKPPETESEAYLYLGSPRLGKVRMFASVQTKPWRTPDFGGGVDLQFAKKTSLRAEGFYTERRLAPSYPSTWFSVSPPLPERDFHLAGAGLFFTSPAFGAAFDGAYSETFAWGRDMYGSLSFRVGDKPWQVSAGVDAAGSRFVDRDGAAAGPGFRTAVRVEWKGAGSSRFRAGLTLRGPEPGESFNRGNAAASYRFPQSFIRRPFGVPFRPGTLSLTAARDGRNPEKISDSFDAGVSFYLGPVRAAFSAALLCVTDQVSYDFNSAKISGELSYYTGPFLFKTKAGYAGSSAASPGVDLSWYLSIRGRKERPQPGIILPGRFSVKVSSSHFPEKWAGELSWRLEAQTGNQ